MAKSPRANAPIAVETLTHAQATRLNIPTAEFESVMREEEKAPVMVAYGRRNRELDPQLVWRGKDEQDLADLMVAAPPLYIQEKVHPKVLIDDLKRRTQERRRERADAQVDLFADFNGLPDPEAATEFYQHEKHWANRMISGDSLAVMASLAEREGLRGKVQCIYFDPPYGIRFNSNFQWSTTSRDVKDGAKDHVTREPEMVKAFRDTWRDGIHSYLAYLRDRLIVARDLLHESGSIFVQIGDENVHRVRALMDEVFGEDGFVTEILVKKKGSQKSSALSPVNDYILWYARSNKSAGKLKIRTIFEERFLDEEAVDEFSKAELQDGTVVSLKNYIGTDGQKIDFRKAPRRITDELPGARLFRPWPITNGGERTRQMDPIMIDGVMVSPPKGRCWSHTSQPTESGLNGMQRVRASGRLIRSKGSGDFKRYFDDFPFKAISNWWDGFGGAPDQVYVVQTNERIVERCILMTTDPGDLVLDPTCGSGTTAYVAEQWGRRWITIDTSRVSLALARSRIMGARYPYYILADSPEGQRKEAEVTQTAPRTTRTHGNIRHGFVYRRSARVTSGSIANNAEIDVIWERWQETLEPLRAGLNAALGRNTPWEEWQIPRDPGDPWDDEAASLHARLRDALAEAEPGKPPAKGPADKLLAKLNEHLGRAYTVDTLPEKPIDLWNNADAVRLHGAWWQARIARQTEIDASISAKAEYETLYDKPYPDPNRVRVAGPFTVESLSPHRVLAVDDNDELFDVLEATEGRFAPAQRDPSIPDFAQMVLENLRAAGVQQARKGDRISFTGITGWPGRFIGAVGRYMEGDTEKQAGILIGPEFGTVSRPDLVAAAREAGDARFDIVVACAFNFDAHSAEFDKLGRVPVLKARMNPDLMMSGDLAANGAGNLFVVFGEPDIRIEDAGDDMIRVRVYGVDVFKPQTGEIASEGTDGIALWMLDTDYNEESFFVRHAYFLGANDPYKALKTTLKAEIDEAVWESLHSDVSRPFPKPKSGRIAVKVINHLGDEVMKVFGV